MKEKNISKIIDIIILIVFFITSLSWAIIMEKTSAPDEAMRYMVPKYIYNHNSLPAPDDPEVVHPLFNASYAYYPLLLGSILSAICMEIVGIFTANEMALLIAARFVSVVSGTIFVFFLTKIAKRLFTNTRVRYFAIILGAFIPQFVYLSSYVNNDSLALAASSMMVYAWIWAIQEKWNLKNSILLAVGIIICALSYYNAYGWILMSIVMFIICFFYKKQDETLPEEKAKTIFDYKNMFKYGIIISIIVLLGIGFLFIRNCIINDGDMLGMKSFMNACEEGARDDLKPSLRNTAKNERKNIF